MISGRFAMIRLIGVVLGFLLVTPVLAQGGAEAEAQLENRVRAAFLFNFARFTDWPENRSALDPFIFCVHGSDSLLDALRLTVQGKTIGSREARVQQISQPEEAAGCQLIYLPALDPDRYANWLRTVAGKLVLTVGEGRSFIRSGGMVAFQLTDGKLRFSISQEQVLAARLQMSSRLLGLADIVRSGS